MSDQDQQDNRSVDEIEADINRTRSHLDDTLSDFQERFSSDHMMQSAMEYVKSDSARDYFSNLGRSIRDNPMPAAMIGVGIGWLIYSQSSGSGRGDVPTRFDDKRQKRARHAAVETPPQTHEYDELYDEPLFDEPLFKSEDATGQYRTTQTSGADEGSSLRQRAGDAVHGVGERAHNMKTSAGDRMQRMKQGSSDRLHGASDRARDAGSWLSDMAHENPVAAGALGLAAGALLGSLLPASRAERRAMGDTRDHLVDRASEMGSEQLNRASDKARETTEKHASDDRSSSQTSTSTDSRDASTGRNDMLSGQRDPSLSDSGRPWSTDSSDTEPRFGSDHLSTDHVPGNTRTDR